MIMGSLIGGVVSDIFGGGSSHHSSGAGSIIGNIAGIALGCLL